ncbi:SURF1 family protein [Polynucleobacter difficilis]|uniref:SURF1 family protein n=1 Tax=Polynucleobacter difficilis TaxID=556054 RepID=UPI001F1E3561|nr:SURF1 family protein [Polynucleobacter difficilis]
MNILSSLLRNRIIPTIAMVVVMSIGIGAGLWQMSRAAGKIEKAEKLASQIALPPLDLNTKPQWTLAEADNRRLVVEGAFLVDQAIWLDNRPQPGAPATKAGSGQSGFYVLMPFRLAGMENTVIWVQRGWGPRNREDRLALPPINTPSGALRIEGVGIAQPDRVFELGDGGAGGNSPVRIQQNLDLTKEAERHRWQQIPFVLKQIGDAENDGLMRNWTAAASGVERHYAYAFQWFALALSAFLFWLIHGLLRIRQTTKR